MALNITPKFKTKDFANMLLAKQKNVKAVILLNLQRIGEQFVNNARSTNTYTDRTGNLRSSVGYIILLNGQKLFESFQEIGGPEGGGPVGVSAAATALEESSKTYPTG